MFKERLSQSALVAEMGNVEDREARAAYDWLVGRGMHFELGTDETSELALAGVPPDKAA